MNELAGIGATMEEGGVMVYPLAALVFVTVVILLEKGFVFSRRTRLPPPLVDLVESYGFGWDELGKGVARLGRRTYFDRFFGVILAPRDGPA
jgi:biopolymer transport protein ExbB